jgi:hypothetical protein
MSGLRSVPFRPIAALISLGLLPAGCLVGGRAARPPQRDDDLFAQVRQQEKWANQAAGRASREELKAAQEGDADAQADLRQRFRKLLRAAERATWVREATPAALQGRTETEKADLIASFDWAARLRKDAWEAADEIAQTLCAIDGPSPLSLGDLRRGLATVRAAQTSEKRIAKLAPTAPETKPGTTASTGEPKGPRLDAAGPPSPRPFIVAAALLLVRHPAEEGSLRSFRPELAEEATQIRAALTDLRAQRPPEADASAETATSAGSADVGVAAAPAPPSEGAKQGEGERRIDLKGEARAILVRKGPPRSISLRPDGTFVLRYDGPSRCPSPPCPATTDLHFAADGKQIEDAPWPSRSQR